MGRRRSDHHAGERAAARYLVPGERIELAVREHPMSLVADVVDAAFVIIPMIFIAWGIRAIEPGRGVVGDWVDITALVVTVFVVLRYVGRVIGWDRAYVVITDQKVLCIRGVVSRHVAATPLAKVSEYTVRQRLLGRIFDYGSLVVDVPGGRDQALHGCDHLPDPAGIYRLICQLATESRMRTRAGDSAPITVAAPLAMPTPPGTTSSFVNFPAVGDGTVSAAPAPSGQTTPDGTAIIQLPPT